MSRITWIIGNWKQNHRIEAAEATAKAIAEGAASALGQSGSQTRMGIAPSYLSIGSVRPFVKPASPVWLFGQDVAAQEEGAFTGEVGPAMLREAGAHGAIVGHSERRAYYGEDDALIGRKVQCALCGGLSVVLCVGEALEARDRGEHESVVISQLSAAFDQVKHHIDERLVIAYEPVWAIGTGRTASPEQASSMHQAIRRFMSERFGPNGRDRSILYGGSVKPNNAAELMAAGDIDGFLVGGASLEPASFLGIVRAAAGT